MSKIKMFLMMLLLPLICLGQIEVGSKYTSGYYISDEMLTENVYVYFSNTMSTAEIQAEIDSVPKNLGGRNVYFIFTDVGAGKTVYTLTDTLNFRYFYNGTVRIQAGTLLSDLSTSQYVQITAGDRNAINISWNECDYIEVSSLEVRISTGASNWRYCIISQYNNGTVAVLYCYLYNTTASSNLGVGFLSQFSCGRAVRNNFNSLSIGLYSAICGWNFDDNNADVGTMPRYGCYVTQGGILQRNAITLDGSIADNYLGTGGLIVTSAGVIIP